MRIHVQLMLVNESGNVCQRRTENIEGDTSSRCEVSKRYLISGDKYDLHPATVCYTCMCFFDSVFYVCSSFCR